MEETYQNLRERWRAGERDREQGLHLLFLAWMHWAEPDFLTGMAHDPGAQALWHEIFDHFAGEASTDAEFLWVAGLMATIAPWALGVERIWQAASERLRARAKALNPAGFAPEQFEGRGEYGKYFAHQARETARADLERKVRALPDEDLRELVNGDPESAVERAALAEQERRSRGEAASDTLLQIFFALFRGGGGR